MSNRFPASSFTYDQLSTHADRFVIPEKYYDTYSGFQVRSGAVLTEDEQRYIQQELTNQRMRDVWEVYYKMTPFDMYFLIPRLPIATVQEMLDLCKSEASALKRACNTLRDMPINEYNARVQAKLQEQFDRSESLVPANVPVKQDTSEMLEKVKKMNRYMDAKAALKMPKEIGSYIHEVPEYMVKRVWRGPQFTTMYRKMKATYPKK